MVIFLKLFFVFFIQSFVFKTALSDRGEENQFIWDLYLGTTILSAGITFFLGNFLGMYFPVYFFSLLFIFLLLRIFFYKRLSISQTLTYFGLNVYIAFFAHIFFSFSLSLPYLSVGFALVILVLFLMMKNMMLGMYLLPFFWYLSIIAHYLLSFFLVDLASIQRIMLPIDHIIIVLGMVLIAFLEIFVFKLLKDEPLKLEDEVGNIMKFRVGKSGTSQVLRVGI